MKKLKVGVVGLHRGLSLISAFNAYPDTEVVAICARDVSKTGYVQKIARFYGIPRAYNTFDDIVKSDLDIIVIATPAPLHAEMTIKALEEGKHVLCEVPMATTLEDCEKIVRTVEKSGLKYMMGENVRWFPIIETIKKLASDGRVGEFFYAEAEYFHNIEPMLYITHCSYPIMWILDDEFVEVQAYGNKKVLKDRPVRDFSVALFKTKNECIVKIGISFGVQRPYCLYFSFYGTKGSFERARAEWDQDKIYFSDIPYLRDMMTFPVPFVTRTSPYEPSTPREGIWWKTRHSGLPPPLPPPPHGTVPVAFTGGHGTSELFMVEDFVRAILDNRDPSITVYDSAASTVAGICALESINSNKKVSIPRFRKA
jgi:predicted dehydrogenase